LEKGLEKEPEQTVASDVEQGAASAPASALIFDLDRTRALLGDDPAIIAEVMDIFISSMRCIVEEQMLQAFKHEQWDALYAHAHELKGAASNIGGTGIALICGELEARCQLQDGNGIGEHLAQLQDALVQVRQLRRSLGSDV